MPTIKGTDADTTGNIDQLLVDIALTKNGPAILGKTPTINFLTTGTYEVDVPIAAGKKILIAASRFVILSRTGTVTGTLSGQVGNNASDYNNMIPATLLTLAAASANGTLTIPFSVVGISTNTLVAMSSKPQVKITGAFGGASVLTGYIEFAIWYVD